MSEYGRGKLVHLRRGKLVRRTNLPCKGSANPAASSKTFKPIIQVCASSTIFLARLRETKTGLCIILCMRPNSHERAPFSAYAKHSPVALSSVSELPRGVESSNLIHIYIWGISTGSSDAYGAMTYISRIIEHRKISFSCI